MSSCFVRLAGRRFVDPCVMMLAVPLCIGVSRLAGGQLVTPKTVPVHQDDQFAIFLREPQQRGFVAIDGLRANRQFERRGIRRRM